MRKCFLCLLIEFWRFLNFRSEQRSDSPRLGLRLRRRYRPPATSNALIIYYTLNIKKVKRRGTSAIWPNQWNQPSYLHLHPPYWKGFTVGNNRCHLLKSVNFQYNTLGCWVTRTIVPLSDGPIFQQNFAKFLSKLFLLPLLLYVFFSIIIMLHSNQSKSISMRK